MVCEDCGASDFGVDTRLNEPEEVLDVRALISTKQTNFKPAATVSEEDAWQESL